MHRRPLSLTPGFNRVSKESSSASCFLTLSLAPGFKCVGKAARSDKTVSTVYLRFMETVKTVLRIISWQATQLKLGVNEIA